MNRRTREEVKYYLWVGENVLQRNIQAIIFKIAEQIWAEPWSWDHWWRIRRALRNFLVGRGRHTRLDKRSNRVKTIKEGRELQGAPSLRNKQERMQVRAKRGATRTTGGKPDTARHLKARESTFSDWSIEMTEEWWLIERMLEETHRQHMQTCSHTTGAHTHAHTCAHTQYMHTYNTCTHTMYIHMHARVCTCANVSINTHTRHVQW